MIIENSDDGNVIWSRKFCSSNDTQNRWFGTRIAVLQNMLFIIGF
jgi:hypothetical protein